MKFKNNQSAESCPVTVEQVCSEAQAAFGDVLNFCRESEASFWSFEKQLLVLMAAVGVQCIRLFLTARYHRLDLQPFLNDRKYRRGDDYAKRTIKSVYGEVTYGRHYLICRGGGSGLFPLDVVLGLTVDSLTPWVRQWVARLATRMSFAAARMVCQAVLNWAPATETIEKVVLGLGREAAPFMDQLNKPSNDGKVLIIEIDGKCPPTATQEELDKRRGKRQSRHDKACSCGCQRHRGKAKRQTRGSKKRRKKGDKSKNGKEATVVVMYTLRRSADGKLHGPINKKIWATFAGRKAAAKWARRQATKRGFGPETDKTVQIVMDGASGYENNLRELFPNAIFTLDVMHVIERLWSLGHRYYPEGSDLLAMWVEELKEMVYGGQMEQLLKRLKKKLREEPRNGPGSKGRRDELQSLIGYIEPRLEMMRYGEWQEQDLVIATGQVEGAVRQLVGERFDCAGMRWLPGKAEALLHLRCIELNRDWERFINWTEKRTRARLRKKKRVQVLTDEPIKLNRAA